VVVVGIGGDLFSFWVPGGEVCCLDWESIGEAEEKLRVDWVDLLSDLNFGTIPGCFGVAEVRNAEAGGL
jgi:hypothetical protein